MTQQVTTILSFPNDVTRLLFDQMDFQMQARISRVCKRWNQIISQGYFEYGQICGLRRLQCAERNNVPLTPLPRNGKRFCGVSGSFGLEIGEKGRLMVWDLHSNEREAVTIPHSVLSAHWVSQNRFLAIAGSEKPAFQFTLWQVGPLKQVAEKLLSLENGVEFGVSCVGNGGVCARFNHGQRVIRYLARMRNNDVDIEELKAHKSSFRLPGALAAFEFPRVFAWESPEAIESFKYTPEGVVRDWVAVPRTAMVNFTYSSDLKSENGWLVAVEAGDTDEGWRPRSSFRVIFDVFSSQTGKRVFTIREWEHVSFPSFHPFPYWISQNFLIVLLEGTLRVYHIPTQALVTSLHAHDVLNDRAIESRRGNDCHIRDVQIDHRGIKLILDGDNFEARTLPLGEKTHQAPPPPTKTVQPGFSWKMMLFTTIYQLVHLFTRCFEWVRSKFFT